MAELRRDLARDDDLFACAATCCRHLAENGYELLSVYFERSGLLRCYAAIGYWQVHDGFPSSAGVIAATVTSGRPHFVDTTTSPVYVEAAPNVVAEVCAPVWVDGQTVGAVNIESTSPLTQEAMADAEAVSEALGRRVTELGGVPRLTGWRLVADVAARLQRNTDAVVVCRSILDAVVRLSGNDSAALVLGSPETGYEIDAVTGSLAREITGLSQPCLDRMGRWVLGTRSCYTTGEPEGQGFTGEDTLRSKGVETLCVFALASGDEHLGYLMVVDRRPEVPSHELIEQMELLAAIGATTLASARHVQRLVEQSRRDPLTGLGHSRAFGDRLNDVQRTGRSQHAVMSIDVDHFKRINDTRGHAAGDQVLKSLADALLRAVRTDDTVFRTGGDEFAVIMEVDGSDEALVVAERLRAAARTIGVDISIGVALTAPGAIDTESVFARADSALYHVKKSGRGDVHLSCDDHARADAAHAVAGD